MNELIPPIGPRVPAAGVETDRTWRAVKPEEKKTDSLSTPLPEPTGTEDAVSVHFSLKSDAETLRSSLAVIMDKVAEQMSRVFPDGPELRAKLGLPEDIDEYSMDRLQEYFNPENTAQRIIDFTTAFIGAYLQNHEGEEAAQQIRDFTSLIQEGIQRGFEEAKEILGDFDQLGKTGWSIQKTYELVMERLDEFRSEQLDLLGELEHAPVTQEPFIEQEISEISEKP